MNRDDFPLLKSNIVYLDNGATTLKPYILIDSLKDYYMNYSSNVHRGDYDIAIKAENMFNDARKIVADFIKANSNEIAFTNNTTDAMNKIVFGYFKNILKENDEILVSKSEHASNLLPWFELAKEMNLVVKYIPLNSNYEIDIDNVIKMINSNTKVISLAQITNVIGDVRDIEKISKIAHQNNIYMVVDGAQSVPHMPIDVKKLDIDFLAFSAHKMYGPTGVGVLYGKNEYMMKIKPIIFGGGMNATYSSDMSVTYNEAPESLEAGTPNIAGIIATSHIINYLNQIGMDNIYEYELNLKEYAIEKLKQVPNIILYNENSKSGIITFNIDGIFAQDLAIYLNKYGICVRAGNHCTKILKDEIGIKNTVRASISFYNNKHDIDELVYVLSNPNIKNEII